MLNKYKCHQQNNSKQYWNNCYSKQSFYKKPKDKNLMVKNTITLISEFIALLIVCYIFYWLLVFSPVIEQIIIESK